MTVRRRSQGFFGLHFDFHCKLDARKVGGRTTPAMVRAVLDTVRPDYVQIDCKGHPGVSSYPTRVGTPAQDIARDQLAVWRRVTRAAGVPLTMHFSGVWDGQALLRHPSWAVVDAAGKREERFTSVFGPYARELLIPQLVELGRDRGVDAAWVDGDCWAVSLDWSRWSLAAWTRATGRKALPAKPGDPFWQEFVDHCRDGFRRQLAAYVDAVHAACPGMEIASNWAYSTHMPEAPASAVDFISGDFSPAQSAHSARLQARFLMHQGRPWDLMAWGFGTHMDGGPRHDKSALQLCQEAALVISLGGGFQIYTVQQPDGAVATDRLPALAEVGRFCRERQALCHRAESVPEVAVLYSHEDWRRRCPTPFPGGWAGMQSCEGILRLCLDARRHTEILMDHQLGERLARTRVLVLPECHHLAEEVRLPLVAWLRAGGRLLAVGPQALAALQLDLPLAPAGEEQADANGYLHAPDGAGGATYAAQRGRWQPWKAGRGARVLTARHHWNDPGSERWPGAVALRVGRGRVVAVSCELGRTYLERGSSVTAALMAGWLRHLDPTPPVEVAGPGRVEVACMHQGDRLCIHLTSLEGPHDARNVMAWDHIPPCGPFTVRLRLPGTPAVTWEPEGRRLRTRRSGDQLVVEVPAFALHGALRLPATSAPRAGRRRAARPCSG